MRSHASNLMDFSEGLHHANAKLKGNGGMDDPEFTCPRCSALYKVVRMPAEPPVTATSPVTLGSRGAIHCVVCPQEFPSNEGGTILKYFLVSGARRRFRE